MKKIVLLLALLLILPHFANAQAVRNKTNLTNAITGTLPIANGGTGATAFGSPNVQTGTTYTVQTTDNATYLIFNSASAVAVTLAQATTSGYTNGFGFCATNIGAGAVTITPTTSTINGAATLPLYQGQFACIASDGNNYQTPMSLAGKTPQAQYYLGGTVVSANPSSTTGLYYGAANAIYFAANGLAGIIDGGDHWRIGGPGRVPTVGSNACGTTTQGTVQQGTDNSFVFTVGTTTGTGVTSCAVTFFAAYTSAPHSCVFSPANSAAAAIAATTYEGVPSTTTFTLTGTALDGAKYQVFCG